MAFTVGLISLFAERRVAPTLAMTGEMSLRGKVTAVGEFDYFYRFSSFFFLFFSFFFLAPYLIYSLSPYPAAISFFISRSPFFIPSPYICFNPHSKWQWRARGVNPFPSRN